MVRLLIGGSPCQFWSIAKNKGREVSNSGNGWELFKNYIIAKEKFKPDFFLYENNWSASNDIKEQISAELGQPLQRINSNLVSAQNRDRFYCHNFGEVPLPEDRGVFLRDIIEYKETDDIDKIRETINKTNRVGGFGNQGQGKRIYDINGKSVCLSAGTSGGGETGQRTGLYAIRQKSNVLFNVYGGKSQNGAVFGLNGKSKTLSAGTGINGRGIGSSNSPKVMIPTKGVSGKLYEVKEGKVEIKGELVDIALEDGLYEIRMLSVKECCRLQTMPDNYVDSVSASQGYKLLGNGWTAEVIIHLLKYGLNDIDREEEIEVLSLYDGIGTAMYCLKQLGFKNIIYKAYEIDDYAIKVALSNYPEIQEKGDAFQVREYSWKC